MQFIDNFFGNRYPYPDLNVPELQAVQIPRDPYTSLPEGAASVPDAGLNPQQYYNYTPETRMSDMLADMIANFPQRREPSRMQNVLGFLAGLGAGVHPSGVVGGQPVGFEGGKTGDILNAVDMVRQRPYYQELADWEAKIKPVETAANQERYINSLMANTAYQRGRLDNQAFSADTRRMDFERKQAQGDANIEIQRQNANTRQLTYELQLWRAQHPNHEIKVTEDGTMIGVDPQTNQATPIIMQNGEVAKVTSEREKQNLIMNRELRVVKARAEEESGLIEKRANEGIRRDSAKVRTPGQRKEEIRNNINALVTQYPQLGKYFDTKSGSINTEALGDLDALSRQMILDKIYGGTQVSEPSGYDPGSTNSTTPTKDVSLGGPKGTETTKKIPVKVAGPDGKTPMFRVRGPNGQTGRVPVTTTSLPPGWEFIYDEVKK